MSRFYPPLKETTINPLQILRNLADVETTLQKVLEDHREGNYGYITREWGFTAPNGLGGKLGGKFTPWENKLEGVPSFFWPVEAYEAMEKKPYGKADPEVVKDLPPEAEQLPGNTPLHEYLMRPPEVKVVLEEKDYEDYKSAARIFLLLGTLSHLCGNSAPDLKTASLPAWIEEPLIDVAKRLQIEPTLTGHFLVQENWVWASDIVASDYESVPRRQNSKLNRSILQAILTQCRVEDRRYRIKVYPSCFIGSQLVDILIQNKFVKSRDEAVVLARRFNHRYKLFYHVTGDHSLMDKYLFYRFHKKWRGIQSDKQPVELDDDIESNNEETTDDEKDIDMDDELYAASRMIRPLKFLARNASMTRSNSLSETARIQVSPPSEARLFSPQISESLGFNQSSIRVPSLSVTEKEETHKAWRDGNYTDVLMTAIAVMSKVPVEDRRYRLRVYKQCFVGKELINVLMDNECANTRAEAVALGRELNAHFDLFEHVVQDHELKDEYLFFRFTDTFHKILQLQTDAVEDLSHLTTVISQKNGRRKSIQEDMLKDCGSNDAGSNGSLAGSVSSHESMASGFEDEEEFRLENIDMLYPAFGNNHERVNQLVPSCMGYALRELPYLIVDILGSMYSTLESKLQGWEKESPHAENFETLQLVELLHAVAFCVSRCKEEFQLMSTDCSKRGFNSKHVSIRQTQPMSNGVLVRREKGGIPLPAKGVTGTQFPYFHLLDWLLGRHQFGTGEDDGLVAKIAAIDDTFPRPQREYINALGNLEKSSTLRGFLDAMGRPPVLVAAYNHLIECYAGEGGLLQAHCRKLYSYMHNDVQFSTSGTNHLFLKDGTPRKVMSKAHDNHMFASMMFKHMRVAAYDRWRLRIPPLMTETKKIVYSTSESGGYTTVALDLKNTGLTYTYGDVVKVLLPNDDRTAFSWSLSLEKKEGKLYKLEDMEKLQKNSGNGWDWADLWEALGWFRYEINDGKGVPFQVISRYIEKGQILEEGNKTRWVNSPLDLCSKKDRRLFASPPKLDFSQVLSLEPVSPRLYSVSGVETERVFLLVSKPQDGARHHGYERMSDISITHVHCSITPGTTFLLPPKKANLVCIASGTGISPFVGLSDAIGTRNGTTTIVHQCQSSELFLCNSQQWLDFTASNPGACVMGFISGDRSKRNCPMRYVIQNGAFEETTLLGRRSSSAYYSECPLLKGRLKEKYLEGAINLAYCCGGVNGAIQPFKDMVSKDGMVFEFTVESYGVSTTLQEHSVASQIGGTIVNLDHVAPIHPGGDQILHQMQDIEIEQLDQNTHFDSQVGPRSDTIPDHSIAFWQCHPHAYNLHRCLRAPLDADSEAFAAFLERQAMSNSVMVSMATKYAKVALASPTDSKVVRIATELQAATLRQQIQSGDSDGAATSAVYLEALLFHFSSKDDDACRWAKMLREFKEKKTCRQDE
ncbi:mechanosensitive ion channel [Nitzschia inconspicua]|uniref:Mechanosensitive ion channel n=1 Tax=Nitzschia inconspicua TaxID=303405 RepID=A0A9K3LI37_9STRA|nr:mechanosensitive ion channel [Nitzschia inconspicua]